MKILVVEDNPTHLEDAVNTISTLGVVGVEIVLAIDFASANRILVEEFGIDGVISDIFIPFSDELNRGSNEPKYDDSEPCGVGIALIARDRGIPCVLCTDEWHHGLRLNWVCVTTRMLRIKLVDSEIPNAQSVKKNWLKAFEHLKKEIEKVS